MLDNRYNEHPDYDPDVFLHEREVGESFSTIGHMFTYAGVRNFNNKILDFCYKARVFSVIDADGNVEQNIGVITDRTDTPVMLNDNGHFEMVADIGDIFPIENIDGDIKIEKTIHQHDWIKIEPNKHVTRIGGYPSFGQDVDYGQPYTHNPDGILVPIPFLGQCILPDGRYVHAYHVRGWDDPVDGAGDPDDFEWDNPNGSVVIIQGEKPSDSVTLKPDGTRYTLSETAYATTDGNYPTFAFYYQGSEATDEYPYTLFHFPGSDPYVGNVPPNMASYTDVYLVWDGSSRGMLVEQYD